MTTKTVMRLTVTVHRTKEDGVFFHYSVESKDLPVSATNKVNFNVSKIFNVTDEPFISYAYPMGKILAYTMNMSVEDALQKTLGEIRRSKRRKIAQYARKADTMYMSSKKKYTEYMNETIQELNVLEDVIKNNKIYEVPVEENQSSMVRVCI